MNITHYPANPEIVEGKVVAWTIEVIAKNSDMAAIVRERVETDSNMSLNQWTSEVMTTFVRKADADFDLTERARSRLQCLETLVTESNFTFL
jgi:hypothetical protein